MVLMSDTSIFYLLSVYSTAVPLLWLRHAGKNRVILFFSVPRFFFSAVVSLIFGIRDLIFF